MVGLNINIEHKYLLADARAIHGDWNNNSLKGKYYSVVAFGIQSLAPHVLMFHVITDFGMVRSRVPVHALFHKKPTKEIPYDYLQLWGVFGEKVTYVEFEYLKGLRCQVTLKDKTIEWGNYVGTFDWYDNGFSSEPSQYKCGHMIYLDSGHIAIQPNNRIKWKDMSFVTESFPKEQIYVDSELFNPETKSDRWISNSNNNFYYDIDEEKNNIPE